MSNKYYIVWVGRQTGIFNTWKECQKHTYGYAGSRYRMFLSEEEAQTALAGKWEEHYINADLLHKPLKDQTKADLISDSIITTAVVDGNAGTAIIRAIQNASHELLFEKNLEYGTLNSAKYIALVEALKYCQKNGLIIPIYCDNSNIINWVKKYNAPKVKPEDRSNCFYKYYSEAKKWVQHNDYPNELLTWDVKTWGTNPAEDI